MKKSLFIMFAIVAIFMPTFVFAEEDLNGAGYAPSISVVSQNYNSILLSALSVDGSNSFLYQRSEDKVNWIDLATTNEKMYFDNNGIVTGRTYYYRVKTIDPAVGIYANTSSILEVNYSLDKPNVNFVELSAKSYRYDIDPVEGATKYFIYQCDYYSMDTDSCKKYETRELSYTFNNMKNESYYYRFQAVIENEDGDVGGPLKKCSEFATPRTPKIKVEAKSLLDGTITLEWDEVSEATKFIIYRNDTDYYSNYKQIAIVSSGTNYTDTNLIAGRRYYYYLETYTLDYNGQEQLRKTDETEGVYPISKIDTPDFTVERKGNNVEINITPVDYANYYYIFDTTNGSLKELYYGAKLNYTIYNISYGTHSFAVRAVLSDGWGSTVMQSSYYSKSISYIPNAPKIEGYRTGYNQNYLYITQNNSFSEGNLYIYRSDDNKNYKLVKTLSNISAYDDYTYNDYISNAVIGKTYYYKVKLYVDGAETDFSNVIKIKSQLKTPSISVRNYTYDKQIIIIGSAEKELSIKFFKQHQKMENIKKYVIKQD